jgi:flagellar motor switch protein FliM
MLKPVANVLNPHAWIAGREEQQPDEVARERMRTSMNTIPLTVRAVLGSAELTIAELTNLRPGDVVQLDKLAKQELTVWVKDREYFYARAGTAGKRLALQITGKCGAKLDEEE